MEILNENIIRLIILFVAPGFISLKIWGLISPTQKTKLSDSLIEAVIFSSFNYIITAWLYDILREFVFVWIVWVYYLLVIVILPILWPILLKAVLNIKFIKEKIISPIPKSWDYYFIKRGPCFMLIHLNDGELLGGLYGLGSFASSYPEEEDLYLQEVWEIDEDGSFIKKMTDTKGLLINHSAIKYIEFFDINVNKGEKNE